MDCVNLSNRAAINLNKTRKRKLNVAQWKCNVLKRLKNSGQEYVSRSTGNVVPAVGLPHIGKVCHLRCHFAGCATSDEEKQEICRKYYALGTYEKQRSYLLGLVTKKEAADRKLFEYFVSIKGERKQVCKLTFMDVHQIKFSVVRTVQENLCKGVLSIEDKRGKHDSRVKVPPEVRNAIRRHIFAYTFEPVHYSSNAGNEQYLPANLNVSRMIANFQEQNQDIPFKIDWIYREVFQSTGIKLHKPLSDTCRTCDRLHIAITYPNNAEEEQVSVEAMHMHQINADGTYRKMYEDIDASRNDANFVVKVIDLQKVLFSPTLRHQDMFYMRQFSSYNLCIYDGREDQGYMFFWHESEAARGVNEMGSSFLAHIKEKYETLEVNQERTLVVWSDRCRGQFNNFPMICLYLYLINKKYFTRIEHKFLVSGHSYMPCDRLFGLIEKRKKVSDVFDPNDWKNIIEESRPSHPFNVSHLTQDLVLDIKHLKNYFPLPPNLKVTEIASACVSVDSGFVKVKTNHSDINWNDHPLHAPNQRGRVQNRVLVNILDLDIGELPQCYFAPRPLSQEKKENLESMIPFLPPQYRQFYEEVISY